MILQNEVMKIGDKYYKCTDIQEVLNVRIKPVDESEIEFEEQVTTQ